MSSIEEIRSNRPRSVLTARALSIVAAVLWLVVIVTIAAGDSGYPSGVAVAVIPLLLYISGSLGAAKGRRAARVLLVVAVIVLYVLLLPFCVVGFASAAAGAVVVALADVVACVLAAVALVLVFRGEVSTYVRRVEEARRAG